MSKGSRQRPYDHDRFGAAFDNIFGVKDGRAKDSSGTPAHTEKDSGGSGRAGDAGREHRGDGRGVGANSD